MIQPGKIYIFALLISIQCHAISTWNSAVYNIEDSLRLHTLMRKDIRSKEVEIPEDLGSGKYMLLYETNLENRGEFSIPTLHLSPSEHPVQLYLNGVRIFNHGLTDRKSVAVRYKSSLITLPSPPLEDGDNKLHMVLFPRGEQTGPPNIHFDSYENNSHREWHQTLFYYSFVVAISACGILLFFLFLTLWLASSKERKDYLYFSFATLAVALSYINVPLAAPLNNEPLIWAVSRASYAFAATSIMIFASIHRGAYEKYRKLNHLFIGASTLFSILLFMMPDKYAIGQLYSKALLFIIIPALFITLFHSIRKLQKPHSPFDRLILFGVITVFITAMHDIYYVTTFSVPYLWSFVYGYAILQGTIVIVLANDMWMIFKNRKETALLLQEQNRALEKQKEELIKVSKSKERFLKTMAHEFKTPLQGMASAADLVENSGDGTEALNQVMEALTVHMKIHLHNIQNIIDLSIFEEGVPEENKKVFSRDLFIKTLKILFTHNENTKRSKLTIIHDHKIPSAILGDFDHIIRAVVNILTNVTPEGSPSKIVATLKWQSDRSSISIKIEPIETEIHPLALELLSDLPNSDPTCGEEVGIDGIALKVATKLIPLMGGEINILRESNLIEITIPVTEVLEESASSISSGTILLAEDNELNRMLICKMLEKFGYKFITAENGVEAVEQAKKNHPALILMDIQMPLMDGLEATAIIHKNFPDISIIGLTANGSRSECLHAGMCDYIAKPAHMSELQRVLMKYLKSDEAE